MLSRFKSGGKIEGNTEAETPRTETAAAAEKSSATRTSVARRETPSHISEEKISPRNTGIVHAAPPLPPPPTQSPSPPPPPSTKSSAWSQAQAQLDADRTRRQQQQLASQQAEEPSLYAVLQANKASKQAAFEEANRIRNQFRTLDEDEIGFLEDVRNGERVREERERREVEEGLRLFRAARGAGGKKEEEDGKEVEGAGDEMEEFKFVAGGGRKRKREKGGMVPGLVKRRERSWEVKSESLATKSKDMASPPASEKVSPMTVLLDQQGVTVSAKPKAGGLVAYDSDSDDD